MKDAKFINKESIIDWIKGNIIFIVMVAICTVVGACLRWKCIDINALWFDESYTVFGSYTPLLPWENFLKETCRKNAYPVLDFLFTHFFISKFGISEISARMTSYIFGVLSIPLIGMLGKKIANSLTGICAASFLAISPFCIYFSVEARYYSQYIFAMLLYSYFLTAYVRCQTKTYLVLLFICVLYSLNVSMLFCFAMPFTCLAAAIYLRFGRNFWKITIVHLAAGVISIVLYIHYGIFNFLSKGAKGAAQVAQNSIVLNDAYVKTLYFIKSFWGWEWGCGHCAPIVIVFILFAVLCLVEFKKDVWVKIYCCLLVLALPVTVVAISFVGGHFKNSLYPKYLSFGLPATYIIASYSIARIAQLLSKILSFNRPIFQYFLIAIFASIAIGYFIMYVQIKCCKTVISLTSKSCWKPIVPKIYELAKKKKVYIVSRCLLFDKCYDLSQKIYLELIPKERGINIETYFVSQFSKDLNNTFLIDKFSEWESGEVEIVFLVNNEMKFPFEQSLFDVTRSKHGNGPLAMYRLKDSTCFVGNSNMDLAKVFGFKEAPFIKPRGILKKEIEITKNGNFVGSLSPWRRWPGNAKGSITYNQTGTNGYVIIDNPDKVLIGVAQSVVVKSGSVYRMTAKVRKGGNNQSGKGTYARIFCSLEGQKHPDVILINASKKWETIDTVFTNYRNGMSLVCAHMGFADNGFSGEFTDVHLYEIVDDLETTRKCQEMADAFRRKIDGLEVQLLENSDFENGLRSWGYWNKGTQHKNNIVYSKGNDKYITIRNPEKELIGMSQGVNLVSGNVYRLSGKVRASSVNPSAPNLFARLCCHVPGKATREIKWIKADDWTDKSIIFTNTYTGRCLVYFHMGYAQNGLAGDFDDICLYEIKNKSKKDESVNQVTNGKLNQLH